MNQDRYKIIISISHHRISFEYFLKGGDDDLKPMPGGTWPAPLAFYCSPTGIIIGEEAQRAAQANTPNAFANYFEQLPLQRFYTIGGEKKPLSKILLDASEQLFRDFYSQTLFNQYGNLNDNRLNMPLTIVCEADIEDNEKAYILNTFKDGGYDKVKVVDYNDYISRYVNETMSQNYSCQKFLSAWTEGEDLSFSLFDTSNQQKYDRMVYPGLGIDPRLTFVVDTIWNDIVEQNMWLTKETEEDIIKKAAMDFLNSNVSFVNDDLRLSDGGNYRYSLRRTTVDFLQCDESTALKSALERFLAENESRDKSSIILLLRGSAADNKYFENNLSSGFSKVIRSDKELRSEVMRLIVNSNEIKYENTKLSTTITKPSSFTSTYSVNQETASDSIKPKSVVPNNPVNNEGDEKEKSPEQSVSLSEYKRKWREIKAEAKGKVRGEKWSEAIQMVNDFKGQCEKNNLSQLADEVQIEIDRLNSEKPKEKPKHSPSTKTPQTEIQKKDATKTNSPSNKGIKADEDMGRKLINSGKLKEAREWYRDNGNMNKAKLIGEVLRLKKSVDLRGKTLDTYRKSRNLDQIKRIIQELEEYIKLCDKIPCQDQEAKQLLIDYKKIK